MGRKISKWEKELNKTPKKRVLRWPIGFEKMFGITDSHRNGNQNHSEIPHAPELLKLK